MATQKNIDFGGSADAVSVITQCGKNIKVVNITYIDSKGEVTTRDTEPYEFKNGMYYGYDINKKGIRAFKLDNILQARPTNRSYKPQWEVKF
jgi:predicted DNA-binding transcriptional regulator YafY